MKWLIDNQLPHALSTALKKRGHIAIHASELPQGSRSSDQQIAELAKAEDYVVVSKDGDFIASYELKGMPPRLVFVVVGNTRNSELIFIFMSFLDRMATALKDGGLVELGRMTLTIR